MKKNYSFKPKGFIFFDTLTKARLNYRNLLFLFLIFTGITNAFGQGASCATATGLTMNGASVTGLVSDTTVNDPTATSCITGTIIQDGWYSFTATNTYATVTVVSNNRQLVIYAYSGACGSLTQISCANANTTAGGQTETMNLTGLVGGSVYYIRVGNSGAGVSMTLNAVSVSTPPANDLCSGATVIASNTSCITTTGSTLGATDNNEIGECTTATGTVQNTIWYQFQAVAPTHVVTVVGAAGFDTVLNVINACGATGTPTGGGCIDNTGYGGTETRTLTGLVVGNFYKIQIHDYYAAQIANAFTICVTHVPPPTITSLGSTNGCVGTSLIINGTNLSGTTAVTIGGTAATITATTATSLTVTIGTGTTGTVSVTTPGGTATSAATFTVNPLPANPANPTSNSPQCNPPGVTITRAAVPPGGQNYYWQTTSLGTSTTNNAATYNVTTSGTYYIRAQTTATGCWSAGQGSLAVVVDNSLSAVANSPSPSNGSSGACYGGSNILTNITWGAVAGASSYDVYFGAGSLPGSITSTVATNSYSVGALSASTTYYWKIVPKNSCGITSGTPITWTFTTNASPCTCTPTGNLNCTADDYISNVSLNSLNNTTICGTGGYTVYPATGAQTTTLVTGQTYTFSLSVGAGTGTHGAGVWIDFNKNGVFTDAGEFFLISNAITPSTTTSITITVPAGATIGNVQMRVRYAYSVTVASTMSCTMAGTYGETEDYTITLIAPVPCTTPTAQPTSLVLNPTNTTVTGSFTAASPAPSGYLIVRSSSATPPTLVNGTAYAVGYTALTPGTTRVIQGSNITSNAITFTDTGLTSNTRYYYYIFSYNNNCIGAPFYLTTTPLTNNAITCPAPPTAAVNSAISTSGFTVSWTASAAGGSAATINYTLEVYTDSGYTNPIPGSPFAMGTTVTNAISGLTGSTTYYYRIRANNGSCNSTYLAGSCTTTMTNDNCTGALSLTVNPNSTCMVSTTSTTVGATLSQAACAGNGTADDDVWFSFVASGTSHIVTVTPTTITNANFEVFRGACGGLTQVACVNNTAGANIEYTVLTGLTSGLTYFVRVYSNGNGTGQGGFSICITSPPSNDDCSGAIPLTVNTSCSYSIYSNAGATNSTGATAPGCANYQGGDVWFSAVVPPTGELDVTLQAGVITNSGMAFYSGTCGSLTLLDCDDDSNGTMSAIKMTGLTPGQTIYIRVWEKANDNNGSFGICATTPSCPSPSDLYANIIDATTVTVYWTNSMPPSSAGYQYYINTTGVVPTAATGPTGTTAPGVVGVNLTGLITGQKYYFWVRSACGGSDTSTWFGPTNYSPCGVGNGTGTTTLECPSILAGGLGLTGADPAPVPCSVSTCTTLEATYLQLKQPTNYVATEIAYAPPYQYTCLQNPVSVNVDDVWSPTINLPFNFCFYGNNYNKCLMGSNGVLTFDTTNNTPGGRSEWQFNTNLPSTTLFRNSIFGVYHDIDPSKGGEVGWELIALNTGCRALVASWNEIPMYSAACNSIYYTGMIVLYENTNVIEVYVKEKNICATWNNGNAIVGIQNAAGNAAVFPTTPSSSINTNDINNDWTATNKAWRFTPSGPSLTSIQWFEGNATTGTPIAGGTTDSINVCPTVTTNYTAQVTYSLCTGIVKYTDNAVITVTGNKVWNGSTSTDWNTNANWTPVGVPTSADCVIVPVTSRNPIIAAAPDAVGFNLAVYNNAQLTINPTKNLTITDKVTVQPTGIFTINNSASLIQINNVLNSGNIIYKRQSPNIRTLDYVYWSSPVAGFNINNIVAPYAFGPIYRWNTTVANPNGGQGTWQSAAGSTMIAGKGYIARAPGTSPFNNSTFNVLSGSFTGVPNNGDITLAIERGNDQNTALHYGTNGTEITNLSDNWNLLGNPYPSAIRGSQFLFDNNTKIEGNIRLWTHGTLPSNLIQNPFYSTFVYNYTAGDYLTYNFTGTSCCPAANADLFIGAGQGFFVQMKDGPAVAAADNITVAFNNNLRSAAFDNSSFYRAANATTQSTFNVNTIERNRIWLDLINPNGQSDRTLFGYIENATMDTDSFFDCITQNAGGTLIYSHTGDTKYSIQGRSLPFDVNDQVPIGINIPTQGDYKIGIAGVDGIFTSQNIYLKDELLGITHDLKASPYQFSSQTGGINDRFKVVYVDTALGTPSLSFENDVRVLTNAEVTVTSGSLQMESIVVYNLLGQQLDTYVDIDSNRIVLSNIRKNNASLLLKVKLQTGETVTKKIIF